MNSFFWKKVYIRRVFDSEDSLPLSLLTLHLKWPRLSGRYSKLIINTLSNTDSRFLDVGAGDGKFFMSIKRSVACYVGIEPSKRQFAKATKIGDSFYMVAGTAEHLPLKDNCFGVVNFKAVLDHCLSVNDALSEAYRVLQPSGYLFFLLTNEDAWYKRVLRTYSLKRRAQNIAHAYFFGVTDIMGLLRAHNFQTRFVKCYDYIRLPIIVENFLYKILPRKILTIWMDVFDKLGQVVFPLMGGTFIGFARRL